MNNAVVPPSGRPKLSPAALIVARHTASHYNVPLSVRAWGKLQHREASPAIRCSRLHRLSLQRHWLTRLSELLIMLSHASHRRCQARVVAPPHWPRASLRTTILVLSHAEPATVTIIKLGQRYCHLPLQQFNLFVLPLCAWQRSNYFYSKSKITLKDYFSSFFGVSLFWFECAGDYIWGWWRFSMVWVKVVILGDESECY